jgi:DNA-binding transcriptional MerR regulator
MSSAASAYTNKSAEAFRTISEVAIELDVPQHVLRFWESRFVQIRPVKRAGGRRYYRPEDVDLLKGIRALLYADGLTIRGVQKVLKERGLRHVADLGRGEMRRHEPARPAPQVQVIEKIVYVEKQALVPKPALKKPRAPHLRAVPATLDLPFFDEPVPIHEFPVLDTAPALVVETVTEPDVVPELVTGLVTELVTEPVLEAAAEGPADDGLVAEDRERLEDLLEELLGLKIRLQAAREPFA